MRQPLPFSACSYFFLLAISRLLQKSRVRNLGAGPPTQPPSWSLKELFSSTWTCLILFFPPCPLLDCIYCMRGTPAYSFFSCNCFHSLCIYIIISNIYLKYLYCIIVIEHYVPSCVSSGEPPMCSQSDDQCQEIQHQFNIVFKLYLYFSKFS